MGYMQPLISGCFFILKRCEFQYFHKIKQYNNRGKSISSPFSSYSTNDSLGAYNSYEHEAWVNNNERKCKAYITKVYFSDGTTWRP